MGSGLLHRIEAGQRAVRSRPLPNILARRWRAVGSTAMSPPPTGILALLALALVVAMLGAWGIRAPGPVRSASSHRGTLTVFERAAEFGMWPDLDPATEPVAASEAWYFDAIDDQLFDQGLNGNLEPDLATGYKFVNGTTFTIYLRHGVTYSDGTPFDAQSVAANIRRDLEPQYACTCRANFPVASVTTPDNYTVVLHLSQVYSPFPYAFFGEPPNWPVSLTALAKMGEKAFATSPVGAGPFEVESNAPTKLVLRANPHYWQKGHPYLETLIFEPTASDGTSIEAIQSGDGQAQQDFGTFDMVAQVRKEGLRITPINAVRTTPYGIQLNTLKPPFNNILAREAIYYATNPAPINRAVAAGFGREAETPTGPGSLYYEETVPGYRTYDLAKAKALVQQLGGLSFTLLAISSTDVTEMAEALQSEWKQAGIKVNLSIDPFEKLDETQDSGNWQANMGLAGGFDPALSALSMTFSSTSPTSGVHDPTLDGMMAKGVSTVSPSAQTKLYHQMWKYISEKAYFPFLYNLPYFNVTEKSVTGPGLSTNGFQVLWQDVKMT